MRYQITYRYKSAYGALVTKMITVESKGECERMCHEIESVGYRLVDVTRID